ncbi:hypothetical protein, partial [Actinophytocola sediminis]
AAEERTEAQDRLATARQKHAERARRYRERLKTATPRDAEVERHVTPNLSVTNGNVTPNLDARDAVLERHVRPTSTHVTPSTPSQPQVSTRVTANEQPYELPGTAKTHSPLRGEFEHFWTAYPRKVGKKTAEQAFNRIVHKRLATADDLTAHAQRWATLWADAGTDTRFIPHPTTWLNGERWNDDPPRPPARLQPDNRPSTTDARFAAAMALAARYDNDPRDTPRQITGGTP